MPEPVPPKPRQIPQKLSIHGHTRIDPYFWLNQRDNPEVLSYLQAENEYTRLMLRHTEELQEQLYNEMVARIPQEDESVPYQKNGYLYFHRYGAGEEYPTYFRQRLAAQAREEVLLPVNQLAEGRPYYQVVGLKVSENNRFLLYGEDTVGRRKYSLRIKDLRSQTLLPEVLANTSGNAVWANDDQTIFYVLRDKTLRPYKVMRHRLGNDPARDVPVYEETDPTFAVHLEKSLSGEMLFLVSTSTTATEVRYLDADNPDGEWQLIEPRRRHHEYFVAHRPEGFVILSNRDAKNFQVYRAPLERPGADNWQVWIPAEADTLLEEMQVFRHFLVILERGNALTHLRIVPWDTGESHRIRFEEEAYTCFFGTNAEFDTEWLRFCYTSLTTPLTTYDYNMRTRERKLLKQERVVGEFDPQNYQTARLWATAPDGTRIPMSLVWKKSLKQTQGNPLLLYGYGAYGISSDPVFRRERLSLLDRGFVFAIAHVRGGQEMGRRWYEQGRQFNKMNTFTDFIACADYLIETGWTSSEKLGIFGGSAGGLLIGAVINLRPELFRAAVAVVPFVDVVTTMLDESIPLTTGEFDEWGDPRREEDYHYILGYSPYDNVKRQSYPALLVTAGLHDSQVQYWEPAKWVAKLRDHHSGSSPILLFTQMEAGHSGASGRFRRLKEVALEYAFLLDQLGTRQ